MLRVLFTVFSSIYRCPTLLLFQRHELFAKCRVSTEVHCQTDIVVQLPDPHTSDMNGIRCLRGGVLCGLVPVTKKCYLMEGHLHF